MDKDKKVKILVIRFKQIGDAILSSIICKNLKENYPNSQIDYVLYDYVVPLFKNQKFIDNVISISSEERKNPFKYIKKVWDVTREDYDIVIDIMSTPKSELFTLFSRKAKYKIGRYKKNRGYTYTHSIKEPVGEFDKSEKFLKMLTPLKLNEKEFNLNYSLDFLESEKEKIKDKMFEADVDFNKLIIPFAINSRREHKVYPIDLMKELVTKLLDRYNCEIILFYSPEEKEFALNFHKSLDNHPRIFSNITTDSIRELGALFSHCDLFVGNEGGPRHLAQSVDLPSFAIFSPGSNKKDWMLKNIENHFAIEPRDIKVDNFENLTYEEKYRLITPDIIIDEIEKNLIPFCKKNNIYRDEYFIKSNLMKGNTDDIFPVFQPKINLENNKIIGAEALARWKSKGFGMIAPDKFISIAEDLNLIHLIDYKIAEESIKTLKELQKNSLVNSNFKISFNFSIKTIERDDVINEIERILKKYDISGDHIEIEITESTLSLDFKKTLKKLNKLKKLNIQLSMDDFPTGHSTAYLLSKFPIDVVKFDKSILDTVTKKESIYNKIYKSLINLVRNLKLEIVAEGVEKDYQLEFLKKNFVKIGQGYLFSKPVSVQELKKML